MREDLSGRWRGLVARLGCSPAEALAVLVLLTGAALALALLWWQQRPVAAPVVSQITVASGSPPAGAPPQESSPPDPTPPPELHVHVTGEVAAPGVYALPAGARVVDAVERAGGPTAAAELDRVNLALALTDGAQVRVPAPGEVLPAAGAVTTPDAGPAGDGGAVDLNTADVAALDALPGVGPVTAQKIVDHRAAIGRYTRVDQLLDIRGIGEATLAEIEPLVTVGG